MNPLNFTYNGDPWFQHFDIVNLQEKGWTTVNIHVYIYLNNRNSDFYQCDYPYSARIDFSILTSVDVRF